MADHRQHWVRPILLMLLVAAGGFSSAVAGIFERALMPGPVSAPHAKYEAECERCHSSFKREQQPQLCLECHQPVAADLQSRSGFHGRQQAKVCADCHGEHQGLDFALVRFDPTHFDHDQSDFALRGKHAQLTCSECHAPDKRHRDAGANCKDCHTPDDRHAGRLGQDCGECHDPASWTHIGSFDHSRTRFELRGAHVRSECRDCHGSGPLTQALAQECSSCHAKQDPHRGSLGSDCASCHVETDWRTARFDHRKTGFELLGAHRDASCKSCHRVAGDYAQTPKTCGGCHAKDDLHRDTLGGRCESCHDSTGWKPAPRFDHRNTRFALTAGHARVACRDCHADPAHLRNTSVECVSCHRDDDTHHGRNGERCADCHDAVDWKKSRFDHDLSTQFALKGAHQSASCASCHTRPVTESKPGRDCRDCHLADDAHQGKLGTACADCHQEQRWMDTTWSHDRSRFVLIGAHRPLECKACHRSTLFAGTDSSCQSCHRKDDRHQGAFGENCADCHSARDWRLWDFDHRRTEFALTGAHARSRCAACHRPGVLTAPTKDCADCHARDDAHQGGFGRQCARCHSTTSFREVSALQPGKSP